MNTLDGSTGIMRLGSHGNLGVHVFADPTEFGQASGRGFFYQIEDNNNLPRGADDMFVLRRSAVNDAGNRERGFFMRCIGNQGAANGGTGVEVFRIRQNGKLLINATDDTINGNADNEALLQVRSQFSPDVQPCPYISMRDSNGITRHQFGVTQTIIGGGNDQAAHSTIIGKQDPDGSHPNILRCGATPGGDGFSGSGSGEAYWRFYLNGQRSDNNRHTYFTMWAVRRTDNVAVGINRVVTPGQTYGTQAIQMLYSGRILLKDTEAFRGAEDVLRKDEVAKAAGITLCTKNSLTTIITATYLGTNGSGSLTANDTSSYTIASNNPQLSVTQSGGVLTVPAGTFLTTVAVDAFHDSGVVRPGADFSIELLKNGSVVAETKVDGNPTTQSVGINVNEVPFSLNYSELITTSGNTTYQLRAKYSDPASSGGFLTRHIRLRRKSVHIQHLGES
tara:strand:- start:802 stop:2148 length:1347 start_codon:yes stop_codon:yes gene_type:complete